MSFILLTLKSHSEIGCYLPKYSYGGVCSIFLLYFFSKDSVVKVKLLVFDEVHERQSQ